MKRKVSEYINNFFSETEKNKFLAFLFLISTFFFIYQHFTGISWDFSVYLLNSKHFFNGSLYFEWLRPPLPSIIIGFLSFSGWIFAEYLYIFFVSLLFLYSVIAFSNTFNIDNRIFYALMLNPYLLVAGLSIGTELLSLSFIMLFISSLKKEESKGSVFLSLAFLTRYTNGILLPLIILYKTPKKIILSLLFFTLILSPWLGYNYLETGSIFTSIADSYALNVLYRSYINMPFDIINIFVVLNYLVPFFLAGFFIRFRKFDKNDFIMISIAVFFLYSAFSIPVKETRHLFNLLLPAAYFSYFAVNRINLSKYLLVSISALILAITALFYPSLIFLNNSDKYTANLDIGNCTVLSNVWVYLNYYGIPSDNAPRYQMLKKKIDEGYRIVLFKNVLEPEYTHDEQIIMNFPLIYKTDSYIILGNEKMCVQNKQLDRTYVQNLNEFLYETYNYTEESSPCKLMLPKFSKSICLYIE